MNNEKRPQQVPANADGNLRDTQDDESALHSDWGSDESIRESVGDGQPRDDLDEHREALAAGCHADSGQTPLVALVSLSQ